jgi:pyruvate,water dikinase
MTEKLVEWGITSVSVNPDVIDRTRKIVAAAEAKLGIKVD